MSASGTIDNRYTIASFVSATSQKDHGHGIFEMESPRTLEINLDNTFAWIKMGSMIAYRGNIKFTREGVLEHGLGKALKKAVTGEGTTLTKAQGQGSLYVADHGKKVFILNLQDESIIVSGKDLLAFEGGGKINWDIKLMRVAAMAAGGLTNIKLEGNGMVAITTHYEPMTLIVKPGQPVYTDPNTTVAWSGNLNPDLHFDVSLKTLVGRGSGDSMQMRFDGDGFVVVQPYEELAFTGY